MSDIEKLLWITAVANIILIAVRIYDAANWRTKQIAHLEHEIKILRSNWEVSQETCNVLMHKMSEAVKHGTSKSS